MQVVLLRHGRDQPGTGSERVLSAYGRATVEAKAAELEALLKEPIKRLWSSPAMRAKQTAEALAQSIKAPSPPNIEEDLSLDEAEGMKGIEEAIERALKTGQTAVLVGHNPAITEWFASSLGERSDNAVGEIVIQNGECVLIEVGTDRSIVNAIRV